MAKVYSYRSDGLVHERAWVGDDWTVGSALTLSFTTCAGARSGALIVIVDRAEPISCFDCLTSVWYGKDI